MSQRVLITAGASGIGREMAKAFAATGAAVCVCDIDAQALAAFAQELPGLIALPCDVSDPAAVTRMVQDAVAALGGLDVLVNNAGISGPTAPTDEVPLEDWEKVVRVNLNGTFYVTRFAIPTLKQSPAGSIIVMSSVAGRFGYPNRIAYSTTKWGLIGFTKTLAMELGAYGIRANAILPGAVAGPRLQRVFEGRAQLSGKSVDEVMADALEIQSIKSLVDPRDIAALAVFLASDHGKSISGQMIPIDGDMQKTV